MSLLHLQLFYFVALDLLSSFGISISVFFISTLFIGFELLSTEFKKILIF
ncbi:hypothetical protein CLH_2983 [Clostridium botulinum E3 str. Alaska E43]|nr:hypothetical protein CLH_2983 [Clostridium botulinum E3 str. Alaska E43]